ncbi:hypothetical protein C8R45DRAFT_1211960 [Mycena sanguinolenta]|nr:hypothetical protein C8R45DRAFT_1211960 [Mycena sanguinolenta]
MRYSGERESPVPASCTPPGNYGTPPGAYASRLTPSAQLATRRPSPPTLTTAHALEPADSPTHLSPPVRRTPHSPGSRLRALFYAASTITAESPHPRRSFRGAAGVASARQQRGCCQQRRRTARTANGWWGRRRTDLARQTRTASAGAPGAARVGTTESGAEAVLYIYCY